MDFDAVALVMRNAHEIAVAPYFGRLAAGEVEEKNPGELVTVADRACEDLIGPLLRDIADVPIVGEEAVAADESVLELLHTAEAVWLVDPIDGTANFAAGRPEYALMVAYVERGTTTASWIYQPQFDLLAVASRGAGATVNGATANAPPPGIVAEDWHGVVKDRFLPEDLKQTVSRTTATFGPRHDGFNCAGMEYPALVSGGVSFLFYWRTLPWDHAPGVLLAEEAGCLALRPGGQPYSVLSDEPGLLVARRPVAADMLEKLLTGEPAGS
jgi:fructose-1,6-bisphosphatase/inositol monophosphatase family enzyme